MDQPSSIKKAIIYCRVSSEKQFNEGVSLDAQSKLCLEYCQKKNYYVTQIIKETASASKIENQRLLNEIIRMKFPFDVLVVYNVSRLSRNVIQGLSVYHSLKNQGVVIESIMENLIPTSFENGKSDAAVEFSFTSLLNAAEYEYKLISQRVSAALDHKREQGFQFGKVPFGYKEFRDENNVRKFEENPSEMKIIDFIVKLNGRISLSKVNEMLQEIVQMEIFDPIVLDDGENEIKKGLTFENIAAILNDYKILKRGKEWTKHSVARIIQKKKQPKNIM